MAFLQKFSGFWTGVLCGCAGAALFVIAEAIYAALLGKGADMGTYVLSFLVGCAVFFIPAGIGGLILEFLLQNLARKGALTLQNATWIGALLAGAAGVLVGILWVWLILTVPVHSLPRPEPNLQNFLKIASLNGVEILAGIVIPTLTGVWAGRMLAQQLTMDCNETATSADNLPHHN